MKSTAVRIELPPVSTMHVRAREIAEREEKPESAIWQPTEANERGHSIAAPPIPIEAEMIELIGRPLVAGESAANGHARKERALAALFDRLTAVESLFLHRRLSAPRKDDPLAMAFGRLMGERRARLLAYLGDARRRAALARATPSR